MDKPKIVKIKLPQDESEVPPEREATTQAPEAAEQTQQPTSPATEPAAESPQASAESFAPQPTTSPTTPAEQPAPEAKPARPEKKEANPDGLTDLERSVLEEMRVRGELSSEEEKAIVSDAKARNAPMPQPPSPPAPIREEPARPTGQIEAAAEAKKPAAGGQVEVASEEQHPRVIAGAPPWVRTQAKPMIKQTRVNGVVVREEGDAAKARQGADDHLGQPAGDRKYTQDERTKAADLARKIYERKQREKSLFYKIRKALGLIKEEPLVAPLG